MSCPKCCSTVEWPADKTGLCQRSPWELAAPTEWSPSPSMTLVLQLHSEAWEKWWHNFIKLNAYNCCSLFLTARTGSQCHDQTPNKKIVSRGSLGMLKLIKAAGLATRSTNRIHGWPAINCTATLWADQNNQENGIPAQPNRSHKTLWVLILTKPHSQTTWKLGICAWKCVQVCI